MFMFVGDVLDIMEQRHDWSKMVFTLELFKYVLFKLIPDVIRHTEGQDEEQVRDHYDSASSRCKSLPCTDTL